MPREFPAQPSNAQQMNTPINSRDGATIRTKVTVITGFLGVGKTTVLRNLLRNRGLENRPQTRRTAHKRDQRAHQEWAVLVNEFGDLGIDGDAINLDAERPDRTSSVTVKEVPGGCLCCATAPLFEVALHQLLRRRPARLLIEPTGLGHPLEILERLDSSDYREWIERTATWTLFDPRHLSSTRHREHPIWNDQIHVADILLASKADLCEQIHRDQAQRFLLDHPHATRRAFIEHGLVDPNWLNLPPSSRRRALTPEADHFLQRLTIASHDHESTYHPNRDQPNPHASIDQNVQAQTPASNHATSNTNPVLAQTGPAALIEVHRDGAVLFEWRLPNVPVPREAIEHWIETLPKGRLKLIAQTTDGWWLLQRVGNDPIDATRLRSQPATGGKIEFFFFVGGNDQTPPSSIEEGEPLSAPETNADGSRGAVHRTEQPHDEVRGIEPKRWPEINLDRENGTVASTPKCGTGPIFRNHAWTGSLRAGLSEALHDAYRRWPVAKGD
ncbi:MAG: CobW family GTP-binding protein [Thioalkalivibrionaceae bacterium]